MEAVGVPVPANITEFGQTPMFTVDELGSVGVWLVLHPLWAFRAMNAAVLAVYRTIRRDGRRAAVFSKVQTRAELYGFLSYHASEERSDASRTKQP